MLILFSLASYPPPVGYRYLYIGIAQPRHGKRSHEGRSYERDPFGHQEIVLPAECKMDHENDDDGMPEIDGIGEASDSMENVVVKPFPDISRAWRQEYHESDRNGGKREAVRTMKPTVIKITRPTDAPEKIKKSHARQNKEQVVPSGMGTVVFFPPYEYSCNDDTEEEMESEDEGIV